MLFKFVTTSEGNEAVSDGIGVNSIFFFALFAEVLFPSEDVIFGNNFSLIENTVFPKSIRKSRAMRKKTHLCMRSCFLLRFFSAFLLARSESV